MCDGLSITVFLFEKTRGCLANQMKFSFASNGILRKTVLVPPLNRMNVTTVNKDLCCLVLTVFRGNQLRRKLPGISSLTGYWTSPCQGDISTSDG